jgi:CRP/FNR family transcriptional regulator, cyclic AMP receptor protein
MEDGSEPNQVRRSCAEILVGMAVSAKRALTGRVAELLRGVSLFSELSEVELDKIARVAVPRSYPGGSVILREGDPGDTCYVLRSGRARVVRQHADGRAITLTNLGPGEIFGELAMFGGEVRSATVEAIDDVQAIAILAGDLKRLLNEHPEIAVKLLGALAERLRETNARIARQSFQKVSSRVAGVLAELAETGTHAKPSLDAPSGTRSGGSADNIVVHSTQADLAQLAGTSREAASRFLATLQRAGIVTCKRGRVIVHDPLALQRYIY